METFLKRISLNLERRVNGPSAADEPDHGTSRGMLSNASFNDFSMHIGQEVDDHSEDKKIHTQAAEVPTGRRSYDTKPSPFIVGSAPAGMSPLATTKALRIPHTSVAHILMRDPTGTPRSSLDAPSSSLPTPRAINTSGADSPGTPSSPTTPSRRRKSQKIHGMDYYEFCELVRAGSL